MVQEVHLEDRNDGSRVALCVGRAGKSHWSLSVSIAADGRSLDIQSACRVRETPGALGSAYEIVDVNSLERLRIAPASNATTQNEERRVGFLPSAVLQGVPNTIAWDYAISIAAT